MRFHLYILIVVLVIPAMNSALQSKECIIALAYNAKIFAIPILVSFLLLIFVAFSGRIAKSFLSNFCQLFL